jgi:hypothetical protein
MLMTVAPPKQHVIPNLIRNLAVRIGRDPETSSG